MNYKEQIELLKKNINFLEQQKQILETNGFERIAKKLTQEIENYKWDLNELIEKLHEQYIRQIKQEIKNERDLNKIELKEE